MAYDLIVPLCRVTDAGMVKPVPLHIIQGPRLTDTDTLGISVTKITLKGESQIGIKCHGPKWTCRDAHLASDAECVVDHHPVQGIVPRYGIVWACRQAGRTLALLACHGQIESVMNIPMDYPYTASSRLIDTVVSLGTGELTVLATATLGRINRKRLWCHNSDLFHP